MSNEMSSSRGGEDRVQVLIEELKDRAEQIGLYVQDVSIATPDEETAKRIVHNPQELEQMIKNGAEFVIVSTLVIGDHAFSARVQNPEQFETDQEAKKMLPTEAELLAEKMRKAAEEGRDIFDLDDDE